MKNIIRKKSNIDPMLEARRGKYFSDFSKEAKERINLGIEIYNKRSSLSLSQQELAKKAKTTQKVISRIENGDVNVGFALLNKIASTLFFDHENWARVFNFTTPYKIFILGNGARLSTSKIEEKISCPEIYNLSIK